jgi:DNA-binding MarR family transcriptional regulator
MGLSDNYRDLMRYLRKTVLLSDRIGDRNVQHEIGIGRVPYLILRTISEAEKTPSQQALAEQLSLTKGAVSRQIAVLNKSGWLNVEESPKSRRENALTLTQKGRALVRAGYAMQGRRERLMTRHLGGEDDVAAAVRVLRAICEQLQAEEQK